MNQHLMPSLSPPVARALHTLGGPLNERAGVEPLDNVRWICDDRCRGDSRCYDRCMDGEGGSLVASFPSVKFVGYSSRPSHGRWY